MKRFEGRPVMVLGVSADESRKQVHTFAQDHPLPGPSWFDGPGGPIATAWGVDRYPTVFILDQTGTVRYRSAGVPPPGELEAKVAELLPDEPTSRAGG